MIKTIITDINGVLISEPKMFSERYSAKYGYDIKKMLPFFDGPFKKCLMGELDLKDELPKVMREWGWTGTFEELIHFWLHDDGELNKELLNFYNSTKLPLIVGTQQERFRGEYFRDWLTREGLNYIDYVGSYTIHKNKKTPEFYIEIINKHHLIPKEVVFIDDDPKNISGASQTGLNTVLHTSNENTIKELTALLNIKRAS